MNVPAVHQYYSLLATVPPARAITRLTFQLPVFYGSKDDNVDHWLRKIEHAAAVHGVNDSVNY